ncbi:MAG: hypothetical protein F6K23_03420 [Okeania sp. SIO2C9]|uniref:hypothetical protein n=1 Tax=Okeania sp. SIO2C9 TaxID=2607791 RepID=UPI0013C25050|nr:hypothetical protein [Okeania sp. SIO2C9]NEQ72206.1 hypothetical protein [Okeania sp. SIO2C9]
MVKRSTKIEVISCPVASVLYSKGRQQLIWQQLIWPEYLRARKKLKFPVDIHPWVYTNDTSGHDISSLIDN